MLMKNVLSREEAEDQCVIEERIRYQAFFYEVIGQYVNLLSSMLLDTEDSSKQDKMNLKNKDIALEILPGLFSGPMMKIIDLACRKKIDEFLVVEIIEQFREMEQRPVIKHNGILLEEGINSLLAGGSMEDSMYNSQLTIYSLEQ